MRNKFFIFSLCLAMFFTIFSSSALAASEYDGDVTLANYLRLGAPGPNGGEPCTEGTRDISLDWASVLLEEVDHSVWYGEVDKYSSFVSAFEENVEAGSGWFVQQVTDGPNGTNGLEVRIGIFEPYSEIYFDNNHRLAGFEYGRELTMYINHYTSECKVKLEIINTANTQYFNYVSPKNLFLIATDNITYPAGYEGKEIPSAYEPPQPSYVAMGDSFSSGEGNPPFEAGTDEEGVNTCHRSPQAYPRLLQGDAYLDLGGPTAFVACSGATTASMSSQMSALSEETKVVTITIGGNDIGFKEFATACVISSCAGTAYNNSLEVINGPLYASLEEVYNAILEEAENAQLYVIGYPHLVDANSEGEGVGGPGCPYLNEEFEADAAAVYSLVAHLNSKIEEVVWEISQENSNIYFVDPNKIGSPFEGHGICYSIDPYFNNLQLPVGYSFHPNEGGHIAYEEVVAEYLSEE